MKLLIIKFHLEDDKRIIIEDTKISTIEKAIGRLNGNDNYIKDFCKDFEIDEEKEEGSYFDKLNWEERYFWIKDIELLNK